MASLSKPVAFQITDLDRGRRRLTRYQNQQIKEIFPFLKLPTELRFIIYDLCLSFKGIETFFETYYKRLNLARLPSLTQPPRHPRRTPTILLLNRQIYTEAITLLQKKTINFAHGLLDIQSIQDVISTQALQKIGTLNITIKDHPFANRRIIRITWTGFMSLLSELSTLLADGHQLKKLVVDLRNEELTSHTFGCWHDNNYCDYRDQLRDALNNLRQIRGVGDVEIKGLDMDLALELKAHVESKPLSFLDLPGEVRNMVYSYSADLSDISKQLTKVMEKWTDHSQPPPYPQRTTPNIFLLNKQITQEASAIIYAKPLTLTFPSHLCAQRQTEVPNMLRFISVGTLPKIQHIDLKLECWQWVWAIQLFLPELAKDHNLQSFRFCLHDSFKKLYLGARNRKYPDATLHSGLITLQSIRGVPHVTFSGDLPDEYAKPLMEIMHSSASRVDLPKLQAVYSNGEVVAADDGDEGV